MRVKNDGEFIGACVESCIDALDELVIVWNDCTDNSAEIIEKVRLRYPEKIKTYEYEHKVLGVNLTKEEYDYVKSLPVYSPHLLCNYYNFALSKVSSQFAVKIDADQIYFTDKLKFWCDLYRGKIVIKKDWQVRLGYWIWLYWKVCDILLQKKNKITSFIPRMFSKKAWSAYLKFVSFQVSNHNAPVSLSGLDVFRGNDKWYVTLGKTNSVINILPPYNGVGDHLIFKVTTGSYFRRNDCSFYNKLRSDSYTFIEWLVHDGGREYAIGTTWFHVNSMRNATRSRLTKAMEAYPDAFIETEQFIASNYNSVIKPRMDAEMVVAYQNRLFQFIHQLGAHEITQYLHQLINIKL